MATMKSSFLFSIVLLFFHSTKSTPPICDQRSCGIPGLEILFQFPFQLREENRINNQSDRCMYPGFEVFCNNEKQALLKVSNSVEFIVKYISIEKQRIMVGDSYNCPPRRFIEKNIDISFYHLPFQWVNPYNSNYFENVTFLNCTNEPMNMFGRFPNYIPCLSNEKHSIMFISGSHNLLSSLCREIGFAMVPVKDKSGKETVVMDGLYSDMLLRWDTPHCNCQADQFCGFVKDSGLEVTCYNYKYNHSDGNPTTTKRKNVYYFPILWGVSGILLFLLWVTFSMCKDRRQNHIEPRQTIITNIELSNQEPPPRFVFGLDRSRIEEYPKIQVAENGQLSKSIDNVCSICLSEYKPMETLRSMPQCNHHFHVDCIDVWLKMNATCPICRNLPK